MRIICLQPQSTIKINSVLFQNQDSRGVDGSDCGVTPVKVQPVYNQMVLGHHIQTCRGDRRNPNWSLLC